jgi:amidase
MPSAGRRAEYRVSRDDVVWSFGPAIEPVLEVEPGTLVTFETNDCFTGHGRSSVLDDPDGLDRDR